MDRRDFLKISATSLATLPLMRGGMDMNAKPAKDDSYNLVILGDTHYDAEDPEKYHHGYFDPNPDREAVHRKEFDRNGKMWAGRCKDLNKRAACLVDENTKCVFQVGDLIQGDTADYDTHVRFLDDAMTLFKDAVAPNLPFITVAGNHDLRAVEDAVARKAYLDYMPGRLSKELGQKVPGIDFSFNIGPDVFILADYTAPDVIGLRQLLKDAEGARHLFFVVHTPVFPFDSHKYWWWYLMGSRADKRSVERRQFRLLLERHNAIVLCGHTHWTEFMDWQGDEGRITQMTMSSVWTKASQAAYEERVSGPRDYGKAALEKISDKHYAKASAQFDEYRQGLKQYSRADAVGSYKLLVQGKHVYVDFYGGDSAQLTKRFTLR